MDFYDNEFFNPNLYQVVRKDRHIPAADSVKIYCDGLSPFILKNFIDVLCGPLKIIFYKYLSLSSTFIYR